MKIGELNIFEPATNAWFTKTLIQPTLVQQKAWPKIAKGMDTLVVAPTGTGKTLSAFLVFIDELKKKAREGNLKEELYVIYISPLKSLAADIQENLKKPLVGITKEEKELGLDAPSISVGIRTGDTTASERRQMIKHPPHILITTPESLYLLLTSKSGKSLLKTAKVIILDELHAVINTKRGAHLMLSIARLDALCGQPLQRIGLSATIEPLDLAASYLSCEKVAIVAPKMEKKIEIVVTSPLTKDTGIPRGSVWERLAEMVFEECKKAKSVIAFVEGRRFAEKLAHYVNQLGGEDYARTHHGSLSKEQRASVEQALREGELHLLCATSSMELGIDVGEIDKVLQIGCPRSISSTKQRLGRAGHRPKQTSVMQIFPREDSEGLYCGITAEAVKRGHIEPSKPPVLCMDVLAQHLVSMATEEGYDVDEVLPILKRAYPFTMVSKEQVKSVLCMLAGDYEHDHEIPVRPRLLYDRIHEHVFGDAYSRMLAISTAGTIPDRGMYSVKSEEGIKLGELDEEFVFESRVGEKFLLGTFAWKINKIEKDTVIVSPTNSASAQLPFWKGDMKGRDLQTGLMFGSILRELQQAAESDQLYEKLEELGLDEAAAIGAKEFLERQIVSTQLLPDDNTIIVEHFKDETGTYQMMVHSVFGRQVNEPLSILAEDCAKRMTSRWITHIDDEDGFLLYPYDGLKLPEHLLYQISPQTARQKLEAVILSTPVFNMMFRYNSARALMMGVKKAGRQPLWIQRMRSAQMLDSVASMKEHPLIVETKRECLNDYWDVSGVIEIIKRIHTGAIRVHEVATEIPSPMSLPLRRQTEGAMMYDYAPTSMNIQRVSQEGVEEAELIMPEEEELEKVSKRMNLPKDEVSLHSLLMIEGDLMAGELDVPIEWLESLEHKGQACYIEPGLWIAAEHQHMYEVALQTANHSNEELIQILRRALRYRGAQSIEQLVERYLLPIEVIEKTIQLMCEKKQIVEYDGIYYHEQLYSRAQRETIKNKRKRVNTVKAQNYAAFLCQEKCKERSKEELEKVLESFCGQSFPIQMIESILLPTRIPKYRTEYLDTALAKGNIFWQMDEQDQLSFHRFDEIDWEQEIELSSEMSEKEHKIYHALKQRGATFMQGLSGLLDGESPHETLLCLVGKGFIHSDSFLAVRQYMDRDKIEKGNSRFRVNARVQALTAGRFEINRPLKTESIEEILHRQFVQHGILCRETIQEVSWSEALEVLRVWEYTGRARRGYFVEGLSGIQFIKEEDYYRINLMLQELFEGIVWLNACDFAQPYGKSLPHGKGKAFVNVTGTYVALRQGEVIAVLERNGKILRIFSEENAIELLTLLARRFENKQLLREQNRLTIKQYDASIEPYLKAAGFQKEITDYVLYRKG